LLVVHVAHMTVCDLYFMVVGDYWVEKIFELVVTVLATGVATDA